MSELFLFFSKQRFELRLNPRPRHGEEHPMRFAQPPRKNRAWLASCQASMKCCSFCLYFVKSGAKTAAVKKGGFWPLKNPLFGGTKTPFFGVWKGGFLINHGWHGWKRWNLFLSYFDGRVEHKDFCRGVVPLFIKNGTKSAAEKSPHFIKCGGSLAWLHSHFMKSECGLAGEICCGNFWSTIYENWVRESDAGCVKDFFWGDFWWGGLKSAAEYGIICAVGYGELFE